MSKVLGAAGLKLQQMLTIKLKGMVEKEIERIEKTLLRKNDGDVITEHQKNRVAKVALLINNVNKTVNKADSNFKKRNFHVDKAILVERLKQDHMFDIIKELEKLQGQKV
jgi:hypothetical protein